MLDFVPDVKMMICSLWNDDFQFTPSQVPPVHKLQRFDRNFLDTGLGFASQRIFLQKTNKHEMALKTTAFRNERTILSAIAVGLSVSLTIENAPSEVAPVKGDLGGPSDQ